MNSGSRNQVRPGARMRWMVTTKFKLVKIVENPAMKIPMITGMTFECDERLL